MIISQFSIDNSNRLSLDRCNSWYLNPFFATCPRSNARLGRPALIFFAVESWYFGQIWGFPEMRVPQNGWFIRETPIKMYPHFRKPPYRRVMGLFSPANKTPVCWGVVNIESNVMTYCTSSNVTTTLVLRNSGGNLPSQQAGCRFT